MLEKRLIFRQELDCRCNHLDQIVQILNLVKAWKKEYDAGNDDYRSVVTKIREQHFLKGEKIKNG